MDADPINHKEADDATFIEQVVGQTKEMKLAFKDHGHDPYALPDNFIVNIYPGVWIRIVDLLERAHEEGFNRRPT
jgi:hypothetical protein